jgi:hypothetical protein
VHSRAFTFVPAALATDDVAAASCPLSFFFGGGVKFGFRVCFFCFFVFEPV